MRSASDRYLMKSNIIGGVLLCALAPAGWAQNFGLFEGGIDVGKLSRPGSVKFSNQENRYEISGGGSNMWFSADAFYFVWKKISGDVSLAADIEVPQSSGDPHRKGVLMIRQSLEADSAYADAALHGDGLTSLQYRPEKGERTYEIQANVSGPKRLRIEKRGAYVSMSIAVAGEGLRPAGGTFRLALNEPFYVGLGGCGHNDKNLERAMFSMGEMITNEAAGKQVVGTLESMRIASRGRHAAYKMR